VRTRVTPEYRHYLPDCAAEIRHMKSRRGPIYRCEERTQALESWFEGGFGQHVLVSERALLDTVLPGLFGFHLMQLGISRRLCLYESSAVRHRFQLAALAGVGSVPAIAEPEHLPIDTECIDVALLHHVLEFSANPHQLLRETARVVIPHGHVLIVGFNPWSLFGACSLVGRHFGHPVWSSRMLSVRRVADWLELLDFVVDSVQYRIVSPPVNHAPTLQRLATLDRVAADWSLPGGAVYLIHARKQVARLTPVRNLRWRPPRLSAVSLAAPRARNTTLH
jgi:SAM-dependent methyltransferase